MRWFSKLSLRKRCISAEVLIVLALAVFIAIVQSSTAAKDVPMQAIRSRMDAIPEISDLISGNENAVQRSFGLDTDTYEEMYYRHAESGLDVREVLILKCADEASRQKAQDEVESYLTARKAVFRDYGTDQYALLSQAVLRGRGVYCFFAAGRDAAEWEEVFLSLIR